uniref:Uncharacterized protein n=1 Tax=Arundo donax TaxID=35708 RepID=A0A0A9GUT1_ARUDO
MSAASCRSWRKFAVSCPIRNKMLQPEGHFRKPLLKLVTIHDPASASLYGPPSIVRL